MIRFLLILAVCHAADFDEQPSWGRYKYGARRDNLEKHRLPVGIPAGVQYVPLPEQFDARDHWPQCPSLRAIRTQGCCGSCWAVSAASAMTDRWCINHKDHAQFIFGALDLIACCSSCGAGCFSGYPGLAWKFWVNRGISSGGAYNSHQGCNPYPFTTCAPGQGNSEDPECRKSCQPSYNVTTVMEDRHFGRVAYSVPDDERRIMEEIYTNGPVQASFDVYQDFENHTGVYRHRYGKQVQGHAVKLLGWGVQDNTKYWLAANSWGTEWGENGFFKIVRGENHVGIESDINTGLPHYAMLNEV